jgi:hypothetical protein
VPNARANRESCEVSVVGMTGIPDSAWLEGAWKPDKSAARCAAVKREIRV